MKVVRTEGNLVKIGIDAPPEVPVHRQEIYEEIQQCNKAALTSRQAVPPTINLDDPDPECDLCHVPHHAQERKLDVVVNQAVWINPTIDLTDEVVRTLDAAAPGN